MIGIDLGTTFSAVAKVNELGKPEMIMNRDGENILPSVVLFQDEQPIVGTMAKRSALTAPLDTVQFVKRAMGDPSWRFETTDGTAYRPEEISAIILKRLKEDAELALGGPVTDAVITVPAYFDDAPRRATMDAGQIAGLNVRRVLNEPTAAALAYGLDSGFTGTVLVYDLGGGTFDVTLMRISAGADGADGSGSEFEVLGTQGDRNLGGFDWDNALMRALNERFIEAGGSDLLDDESTEADLREKAEIAKHSLTTVEQTRVVLAAGGVSKVLTVTRQEFEDLTSSLVSRTRDIAQMVVDDAGLEWAQVDRVLLAGGSTRMPMIRTMMEELTGRQAERSVNPDEVVALGAAVQAHLVETAPDDGALPGERPPMLLPGGAPVVLDVTSQGLGVIALDARTKQERNFVIIPPNTKIPAKRSDVFETVEDNQRSVQVEVTQGDDEDPEYVRRIGTQTLDVPPYPAGSRIEVVYAYDIDQTVFIEVNDLTAGASLGTFEVENVAAMDAGEVTTAMAKVREIEVS